MAILNKFLNPTVGEPTAAILSPRRKRRNMTEEEFYQEASNKPRLKVNSPATNLPDAPSVEESNTPQFMNQPVTGNYIQQQLQNMANRPAVPQLNPGARVTSPNMELVKPSNFQGFYEQLGHITGIGEEALGAERARSRHREQQRIQQMLASMNSGGGGSTGGSSNSGGGRNYGSGIPSNPQANFRFARQVAPKYGWGPEELSAWYTLGMKESGWRNTAQNPTSTAYGIGQFLDSTWRTVGGAKTSDPRTQVDYMARYIKQRYGSPSRALNFHLRNNWY